MGFAPMSEEEQAEFMENTVDDIEEVQEQEARTQEEMIQRFKNMRAMFVRPGGFFAEQMMRGEFPSDTVQVGFSLNADTKPKSSMRSLRTLKPMTVQELDLGTTHRGRYLCGWVAIDDAFFGISSSSLLLEDVTGRLVEIAAYGLVEIDLPPTQRQRALASGFPKGKPIAVIEPYYKVRMDGSVGIRVDDAQELVPWRDVPTDLISWKKLGNEYFSALNTQNQGRGALACYQRSIEAVQPEAHTIAVLLSNLATCRFKMGDYVSSIHLSGAAAHLNPGYFKGWFRLASALAENEAKAQRGGEVCHPLVVARVVALYSPAGTTIWKTQSGSAFDQLLEQYQARVHAVCPVREKFFLQVFEELIREVACECPERGLMLLRVRDELRLTIEAHQTLYHNSIAYGRQKAVQAEAGVGELELAVCRLKTERDLLLAKKKELTRKVMYLEEQNSEEEKKRQLRHSHTMQFLQTQRQELDIFHREMTRDPTWK
ncbi:hypothetical protein KRP22_014973 [Phytophthora ramorum]|nr:33 kDa inner dynein arm light chain, axonemal [Phytophthora ramorum]